MSCIAYEERLLLLLKCQSKDWLAQSLNCSYMLPADCCYSQL